MNVKSPEFATLPEQVRNFCLAVIENAKGVRGWDEDFRNDLIYIECKENGDIEVTDNFERFFSTIYTYRPSEGKWYVRRMYSDSPLREYTFRQCMSDASMMYTG